MRLFRRKPSLRQRLTDAERLMREIRTYAHERIAAGDIDLDDIYWRSRAAADDALYPISVLRVTLLGEEEADLI